MQILFWGRKSSAQKCFQQFSLHLHAADDDAIIAIANAVCYATQLSLCEFYSQIELISISMANFSLSLFCSLGLTLLSIKIDFPIMQIQNRILQSVIKSSLSLPFYISLAYIG